MPRQVSFSIWTHGTAAPETFLIAKVDPSAASSSSRTPFADRKAARKTSLFGLFGGGGGPSGSDSRRSSYLDVLVKSSPLPKTVAVHEDELSVVPLRLDDEQEGLLSNDLKEGQGGSGDRGNANPDGFSTDASGSGSGSGSAAGVGARDSGSSSSSGRSAGGHSGSVVVERWLSVQLFNANNLLDLSRNK